MEQNYFDRGWELRKEAEQSINQYIAEHGNQQMNGKIIATTEHYAFGIQVDYLQMVANGAIYVSDNEDDEENDWYRYDFTDVFLHSLLNSADAVLQGTNRKQDE